MHALKSRKKKIMLHKKESYHRLSFARQMYPSEVGVISSHTLNRANDWIKKAIISFLAFYRELQRLYFSLSETEQNSRI